MSENMLQLLVVQVSTLEEFMTEVPPMTVDGPSIARLLLREVTLSVGGPPQKRISLSLQGISERGEIVWLDSSHVVWWTDRGPFSKRDQSLWDGYRVLTDMVGTWLCERGYTVRHGRYGVPSIIKPLNGSFADCARWKKMADGESLEVVAV